MARSDVHPWREFKPWQVWPGAHGNPPSDGIYPWPDLPGPRLNKRTSMASMGSCFAREIKHALKRAGCNYLEEETDRPAAQHASAAWERLYNTFSMRQIFEYTFESFTPRRRWWISPQSGLVQDPFRRIILYSSPEEAEADFERHRACSRRVLEQAEVLILTLGLTEIWADREDGAVICLPSGPYVNEGGDMSRYEFRVSRHRENLDNLERIHAIMKAHNPSCRLIVTVSPVHLWATFREDADIISASCNSKSTLRSAVDEFAADHDNVHYFPAYEMAAIFRPMLGQSIFAAGRENFHVNQDVVEFIMRHFFAFYFDGFEE
ncbi:MAG: GSCFA domain-containing protein [Pseudomonadota bacterium]